MSLIYALSASALLQAAFWAVLVASIIGGVVGSYVVIKRISFISGSISHAVLGGMGFCLWLQRTGRVEWVTPMQGALFSAVVSALLIGWVRLFYKEREDSIIAAIWSVGMAIGMLFIAHTPGSNVELSRFLIGNLLWVTATDLHLLLFLGGSVLLIVILFQKQLLAVCFDEDEARLQGIAVDRFLYLLLIMIAVSVVLMIHVVGVVLVLSMLTIPPTMANLFCRKLSWMMIFSVLISLVLGLLGMSFSFYLDWPPGATIALFSGLSYLAVLIAKR